MNQDFFKDLEPWKRGHQVIKDCKGAKGGERDKFKSRDQRCKTRKMLLSNPRKKQNLVWPCHLSRKF
jgi:hypothetical protein